MTTRLALTPLRLTAAIALAAASLTACSTPAETAGSSATAPASLDGQAVDAGAFAALVEQDGVVVLDVRTPEEFAAGHLDGALNVDVSSPQFADRLAELDTDAPYAVYCRSGNRSAQAVTLMQQAGFEQVAHLDGGITAWSADGGEVVTGP